MGFFEDMLSGLGRRVDDAVDRLSGGPNSGLRSRMEDARSWAQDRCGRADDLLARRGVYVSTFKIAGAAAVGLLCLTIVLTGVRTARAMTALPAPQVTPADEQRSRSLSEQIVQKKRAAASQPAQPRPVPGSGRGRGQRGTPR